MDVSKSKKNSAHVNMHDVPHENFLACNAFFIFYFFMILTRGMNVSLPKFPSIPNFLQLYLLFAFQFLIHVFFRLEQALNSISGLLAVICN